MKQSISPSRKYALRILGEVFGRGKFASRQLDHYLKVNKFKDEDRRLLTQLVYGLLREKGFIDYVLKKFLDFGKTPPKIQNILRLSAYQMFFLEKVPDRAAIYEGVELSKASFGPAMNRLVNAVLRSLQGELEEWRDKRKCFLGEVPSEGCDDIDWGFAAAMLSMPQWLLRRWWQRYGGASTFQLIQCFNQRPWVFLRGNRQKAKLEVLGNRLKEAGVSFETLVELPLFRLNSRVDLWNFDLIEQGMFSIQDINSYRIIDALAPQAGELGLDACAGHGGKSAAICERLGPDTPLWVDDISADKLEELKHNFKRLGLVIPQEVGDNNVNLKSPEHWDWILLDAPCSGLGTLGRKPEVRWRLRQKELVQNQERQLALLEKWSDRVKPRGRILYSVCSLEPEEGELVLQDFLSAHSDWYLDEEQVILPDPSQGGDGFFWGRLIRKS